MSKCLKHEGYSSVECVNCGNEYCEPCTKNGYGAEICQRCGKYVCRHGDCCKDRGEGPDGITDCEVCKLSCCGECLTYDLVETHRDDDDDSRCHKMMEVCRTCALVCHTCEKCCVECIKNAFCCECGDYLVEVTY